MQRLIEGVLYDSDLATSIYSCKTMSGIAWSMFEELKRTKNGSYLVLTTTHKDGTSVGFRVITESQAKEWLEKFAPVDIYAKYFPVKIG